MKTVYCFMIGLILFNFYACTKQQIQDPTNLSVSSKLEITYLDENDNPTENRTDDILMKLEEDDSGFIMVSRKAEGTEENEYIDYLIDTKNESTISMYYKNGEDFPYKIILVKGEESMVGYTSGYRESSRDFDIIWQMQEGSNEIYETFKDIPINAVFNHGKTAGVDDNTDYQIKTLKVSVRVADAINKYIDDNFKDNPLMRGKLWNAICSIWNNVFKPIVKVVTRIVAIFVPPVAAIVTTVVAVADAVINTINQIFVGVEDVAKAASGRRELLILKNDNDKGSMYANNENISLNKDDIKSITFDVTEASIGKFELWLSIPDENPDAESGMISGYYKFEYNRNTRCFFPSTSTETTPSVGKKAFLSMDDFNNNNDFNLIIKRLANSVRHDVYIDVKLEDNVFVNKLATDSFQLILQKDLVE